MSLGANAPSRSRESRRISVSSNTFRHRALVRLYERRAAVDNLIDALERYQHGQSPPWQQRLKAFNVLGKSS